MYINDIPVSGNDKIEFAGILQDKIILCKNEFIVLGDNVNESIDSKYESVDIINSNDIIEIVL